MRYGSGWRALLLLGALLAGGEARLEAQRSPERRAQREVERRGWVGFSFRVLGREAGAARGGALIERVYPDSPADRAGLQEGDTIVRWNGREDIEAALDDQVVQPGDSVRLRVRRGGRDRDLVAVASAQLPRVALRSPGGFDGFLLLGPGDEIPRELRLRMDSLRVHADSLHSHIRSMLRDSLGPRLRALERAPLPGLRLRDLDDLPAAFDFELGWRGVAGAEFTEMNPGLAEYFGTDRGALVLRVAPQTPAARAGLEAGDVVVAVNGDPVDGVRDLRRGVAAARDREVELEVVRKGERREVRMRWERDG
jgi:C-terminal processing protease CtpA/Prc